MDRFSARYETFAEWQKRFRKPYGKYFHYVVETHRAHLDWSLDRILRRERMFDCQLVTAFATRAGHSFSGHWGPDSFEIKVYNLVVKWQRGKNDLAGQVWWESLVNSLDTWFVEEDCDPPHIKFVYALTQVRGKGETKIGDYWGLEIEKSKATTENLSPDYGLWRTTGGSYKELPKCKRLLRLIWTGEPSRLVILKSGSRFAERSSEQTVLR